ncbi:MAG TPA: DUF4091 domain-containing protein [Candidatus Hydrogenedentes bacterium]|nr:DUF4091 domain-containing protein [Candidatus Hydrogenedentota bacterium]
MKTVLTIMTAFALSTTALAEVTECILFDRSYGETVPGSTREVGLWWASSGWKVAQDRPMPSRRGKAMALAMAQNETEAAQLVVRPVKDLSGFTAVSSSLAGPGSASIPADCVEILRVRYVNIQRKTDISSALAPWPDPLPPFKGPITLAANINQPLWVRIHVPKDTAAGEYTGHIELNANGYNARVPLRVRVYGFALPDRMTCETAFGFDAGAVYQYQGLANPEDRQSVLDKYWASMAAHHIFPYNPAPNAGLQVQWTALAPEDAAYLPEPDRTLLMNNPLTPVFDWAPWDAELQRVFDQFHFHGMRLGLPGMGNAAIQGFKPGTPEHSLAFTAYCRAMQEHLREKGWLNGAYVYWFDEPTTQDYPYVMESFLRLKKAAPDLRRMLTEQVEPELVGGPNLWCPLTWFYKHEKTLERRAAGDHFWWYVCTVPKQPYCGLFIDHPATDLRVWLWQTWKYDIEGILIWQSNLWTTRCAYPDEPQNPYEDPMSWEHGGTVKKGEKRPWGNGDGRFMYPPESCGNANPPAPVLEGPVDSIRWEMLRDGIEDYEYMAILKRLITDRHTVLPPARLKKYEALLTVPESITKDLKTYTKDPAPIEKRRDELARAIEQLRSKGA